MFSSLKYCIKISCYLKRLANRAEKSNGGCHDDDTGPMTKKRDEPFGFLYG